jgi:hypothetical protein
MVRKPALAALIALAAFFALQGGASASVTNTQITSGPTGTVATSSVSFTFTSSLDGGFQCRLDGGSWTPCSPPQAYSGLADGPHTFEVRALNRPLNPDPTPAVADFVVRTPSPPGTAIVSGPSGTIATDAAIFVFESDQSGSFECRLDSSDDAAWAPCTSPQSYADLDDGAHAFEVRAVNEFGEPDPTPAAQSFATDTEAPETAITAAPSGTIPTGTAAFDFEAPGAVSFQCRLDGGGWGGCESPRTYHGLGQGSHGFEVRATDAVGNTDPTPASAGFAVDLGPPKPEAGKSFNVEPVDGTVELQCPGEDEYSRLTSFKQVPMGCLVNTRHGTISLTSSKGASGDLQNADFWAGVFVVTQKEGDNQKVELKLAGKRMCEKRSGAVRKPVARASGKKRGGRRAWGSGKGDYETSGSYGSATVRGTTWLVADRCDSSTLFKVTEGTVWVQDFVKDTEVVLDAGQQYIAKAAIPRLNPNKFP